MFSRFTNKLQTLFGRLGIVAPPLGGASSNSALEITQDWNTSGNPTLIKANATTGTAGASAKLIDLQIGGTSKFSVTGGTTRVGANENSGHAYLYVGTGYLRNYNGLDLNDTVTVDRGNQAFILPADRQIVWTGSTNINNGYSQRDLVLRRDAANALAQCNSTNAQTSNLYATYTSATSYHRLATTTAKTTLSAVSGATVTATALIPAGANLLGVTTRVNTALGTSNGTTGYAVGTAADPNLWGDVTAVAAGTASKAQAIASQSSGYTADAALGFSVAARDVVITAAGGNFDGTGVIEIAVYYSLAEAD